LKKRLTFMAAVLALVLSSVGVGAQQQAQSTISVNERAERIPNLDKLVTELKQYHDCTCKCGCYAHDLDLQADRAIAILRQRAAHRNSKEKLAVVLDIDETSLSNYQEMLENGFVFNKKVFDAWVETAQAPAIPGSLRIDKEAARLGVAVFFITGRPDSERAATENNLHAQGFNYQQLTLRPDSALKESVGAFKSDARAQIVAEGYKIVLNVGDQWSDLKGGPEAEFSVKYPDPYYYLP
jgi:5'-nucleotidase (lipoprotein e(P4) family)